MTSAIVIAVLLGAGLLSWLAGARPARWIASAALLACGGVVLAELPAGGGFFDRLTLPWMPALGVQVQLGMDGLSLLMVVLTLALGLLAVVASWREVSERVGFFHFMLLWTLAGVVGVFTALDLLLFYFFWELMIVPMYLLILLWGHEDRKRAATKFFLFTQASGLLMLVAILGVGFAHRGVTGQLTFDYVRLLGTPVGGPLGMALMLGFFVAFAVKLPAVPLHTWLPDAHTEAPTAGSVVLAGLLLKTGAYGLLRFAIPLFPQASAALAPVAMGLGVAGILYGGMLAFAQTDLKRLVAYTSVSHLGFVLVGLYAGDVLARQGAVLQMVCHGLSTGGLFVIAGLLQERLGTRELGAMGGLWQGLPRAGAVTTILVMASLGLPGLGNFVAELLVLVGAYRTSVAVAGVAAVGLVISAIYSLRIVQRVFHGAPAQERAPADLSARELGALALVIAALVWLGLGPQPVLDLVATSHGWGASAVLASGGAP